MVIKRILFMVSIILFSIPLHAAQPHGEDENLAGEGRMYPLPINPCCCIVTLLLLGKMETLVSSANQNNQISVQPLKYAQLSGKPTIHIPHMIRDDIKKRVRSTH